MENIREFQNQASILFRYIAYRTPELRKQVVENISPATLHSAKLIFTATATGATIGAYMMSNKRGLQFLAENSHRLPRTKGGWFLYRRAKNNTMINAAGIGAVKTGCKFAVISGLYAFTEQYLESVFGEQFGNGIASGTITSLAFSLYNRFPYASTLRAVKFGVLGGLSIGLVQDAYRNWYGRSIKVPGIMLAE